MKLDMWTNSILISIMFENELCGCALPFSYQIPIHQLFTSHSNYYLLFIRTPAFIYLFNFSFYFVFASTKKKLSSRKTKKTKKLKKINIMNALLKYCVTLSMTISNWLVCLFFLSFSLISLHSSILCILFCALLNLNCN